MNASPLQLRNYFVSDLSLTANREYKPKEPIQLTTEHLLVESGFIQDKDDARKWQVQLNISQKAVLEANSPYLFSLEMVGFFDVLKNCPDDKVEALVKTNGPSVLYGAAREILRALMAHGPFYPLLLPTASFYTPDMVKKLKTKTSHAKQLQSKT